MTGLSGWNEKISDQAPKHSNDPSRASSSGQMLFPFLFMVKRRDRMWILRVDGLRLCRTFDSPTQPHPRIRLVYSTSGQVCSGDLFGQPGRRAHGLDSLGSYEGGPPTIRIHPGLGAIM